MPRFSPDSRPNPDDPFSLLKAVAADNGVGGERLLVEAEGPDFIRGLRLLKLTDRIQTDPNFMSLCDEFLRADDPRLDEALIGQGLISDAIGRRYKERIGHTRVGSTDITQVLAGTYSATVEGLNAICLVMDWQPRVIMEEARTRAIISNDNDD